jgi:hypothetical protein
MSINYDIPSQHHPQQYQTLTIYNPPYNHHNTYDNPQPSYSYNSRTNNHSYTVTHPPNPPQIQTQHPTIQLPPPPPPTQQQQQQLKLGPVSQTSQTTINNPTATFGVILAIIGGSNEDHATKGNAKSI